MLRGLLQRAVGDVLAVLHALEADTFERFICARAGHLYRIAKRGDAKDAPAVGENRLALQARTGVEHAAVGGGLRQPGDGVARAVTSNWLWTVGRPGSSSELPPIATSVGAAARGCVTRERTPTRAVPG